MQSSSTLHSALYCILPLLILSYSTTALRVYCSFGDSCWPTNQEWAAFNSSVSGRLIAPFPPAAICHDARYDAAACSVAKTNWTIGHWRADQPGAYQETNWENGNARCFIDSPRTDPCEQGRVPVLAVAAETVEDIQTAVKFAAQKNLHLVVKNTGHDYLGRSSGVGSFSIWTHKMKGIEFMDSFIPEHCSKSTDGDPAVTVRAGEQWLDVYRAAHNKGVVVVGGTSRSVGAAGGYPLGGGHSIIGNLHGMAVDNILQFTIVTADGKHITANSCTNEGLFWALRGGAGSAWGVVTSVTYKTHPAFKNVLWGSFAFETNHSQTNLEFTKFFYEFIPTMTDAGFRGFAAFINNSMFMGTLQANSPSDPGRTGDYSIANTTFAPLLDWVAGRPPGTASLFHKWEMYNSFFEFFVPNIGDVAVGTNTLLSSRILSAELFVSKSAELAELTATMKKFGGVTILLAGGGVIHDVDVEETSLHPAWRLGGLATLTYGTNWPNGLNETARQAIQDTATSLTRSLDVIIGEGAAAYVNEANPQEPDWKKAFWGPNYERLLDIKREVDPNGVFTCNRCVGSDL